MMKFGVLIIVSMIMVPSTFADSFAWWRFGEGTPGSPVSSVKDFGNDGSSDGPSTGGNPMGGVIYGTPDHGMDIDGLPDRVALDMDGFDDYITGIPFTALTLFDTFTIEAIVNWKGIVDPAPEGKRNISMILQQQDAGGTGRSLLYIQEVAPDTPDSFSTVASFLGGGTSVIDFEEVPSNQWIYVAVTYADGFVTLWLDTDITDGITPGDTYVTSFLDYEDNDAPMIIGRHKSLIDNFHGMISELRITDSGYGEGPNPENPPNDHFTATPAANTKVEHWSLY